MSIKTNEMKNREQEGQLKNKFRELAERTYSKNIYTFTGFLSLNEQDIFWKMEKEMKGTSFQFFGGIESSERKILRFGSLEEVGYEETYPIVCIHMNPLSAKFADDFSHRDFLGALMNLGIERSTIGDILVGQKEGYIFCLKNIAEFICMNLDKVRHTSIRCTIVTEPKDIPQEEPIPLEILISSMRMDAVIAKVYNKSRNDVVQLFESGKIFVDGRMIDKYSNTLKGNESISVRGHGKFIFAGVVHETKKGKIRAEILLYK